MYEPFNPRATPATLASRKRACELAATFIENDLARLRHDVRAGESAQTDYDLNRGGERGLSQRPYASPVTTSHEADVMKAMEWASAATWLRAMAAQEGD